MLFSISNAYCVYFTYYAGVIYAVLDEADRMLDEGFEPGNVYLDTLNI